MYSAYWASLIAQLVKNPPEWPNGFPYFLHFKYVLPFPYVLKSFYWKVSCYPYRIAGRNINNLRYADDTTLIAENEEELKSLLIKVKEKSEKADLKLSV